MQWILLFASMGYIRDEKVLKAVGIQIRTLRISAGYSQQEFAYKCNMELSQINRIELGKVNTSVSVLFKLAETLGVKPSKLLDIDL